MPEQHLPEVDLDRAFATLTSDLATRPGAPGARAAVATARRRRRTKVAAVGALAVLAVGAGVVPQLTGVGDPDRSGDVASSGGPLAFTGAALTEATDGWAGPWREATRRDDLADVRLGTPPCFAELPSGDDNVEPIRMGDAIVLSPASAGAHVTFAEFRSADAVAPILDTFSPAVVEEVCEMTVDGVVVDRTRVLHAHADAAWEEPAVDWWLAVDDTRIAMLMVTAPEEGAPDEVRAEVAALLDRALDSEDNFESSMTRVESGSGSDSSSSSSGTTGSGEVPTYRTLDRAGVMEATDGWPAEITTAGQLSCTAQFSLGGMEWQSMSSDDGGMTTTHSGFGDEAAARAAVDRVAAQLEACVPYDWTVTTGSLRGGRTLWAGSEQGTLVLAQRGATLAWVTIGEPDAPASAVQAIASLLHDTLVVGETAQKD